MLIAFAFILLVRIGTCYEDRCHECGKKNTARILNGQVTGEHEYPMIAALINIRPEPDIRYICAATIISDRYALTVSDYFSPVMPELYTDNTALLVGTNDAFTAKGAPEPMLLEIIEKHIYFNDSGAYEHDIAVVKTIKSIVFGKYVGPACLPFGYKENDFDGEMVTILGWGATEAQTGQSTKLRQVQVEVKNEESCPERTYSREGRLCTFTSDRGACDGDRGGPVLWAHPKTSNLILVGIAGHSFGKGCHSRGNLHTSVVYHMDWIMGVTKGTEFCRA